MMERENHFEVTMTVAGTVTIRVAHDSIPLGFIGDADGDVGTAAFMEARERFVVACDNVFPNAHTLHVDTVDNIEWRS